MRISELSTRRKFSIVRGTLPETMKTKRRFISASFAKMFNLFFEWLFLKVQGTSIRQMKIKY